MNLELDTIKQSLEKVLDKYPVAFAYVFGSVVKGLTHEDSDLDIAIGFSKKVTDKDFYQIFNQINEQLPIPSENLDLKNFKELPLFLRFRIIQQGELVYLKDVAAHRQAALEAADLYHDQYGIMKKFDTLFLKQIAHE